MSGSDFFEDWFSRASRRDDDKNIFEKSDGEKPQPQASISSTCLREACTCAYPKSTKNTVKMSVVFALLGYLLV
jgi:hypothetical protein